MQVSRPGISAFVIAKDEAAKIGACLDSLQWVDEIVVVDDFSSDATPDICRNKGVSFHQHAFTGFRDQKSFAMTLTSHDWVLEIDADERVSPEMRQCIENLNAADFETISCYEFRRITSFWGKWIRHASFYPDYKGRLYHKRRGMWSEANIHERFIPSGKTRRIAADIIHDQNLDICSYFRRTVRYGEMSAADLFARGRRACWLHLTFRPLYTFFYRFVVRLGFLDGMPGFVISAMGAVGTFAKYSKLYELQRGHNTIGKP
jgi:glycosyltransferase involved in cell wall biosynthesis